MIRKHCLWHSFRFLTSHRGFCSGIVLCVLWERFRLQQTTITNMTTVGVDPVKIERVNPMNIPSYSYQYPSFQRVQLAAVKDGLFHPKIPSFRRMDMDTAGHKLPDEHCRTTTTCGPGLSSSPLLLSSLISIVYYILLIWLQARI